MGNHEQPHGGIGKEAKRLLCTVYGLFSTQDGIIRYIGQTIQPPQKRLIQHLADAKHKRNGHVRCYRWIRRVLRDGHEIGVKVLETNCLWDEAERRWIAEYRRETPGVLTNTSEGGCGYSGARNEATRAKMRGPKSEAHKASMKKPKSQKTRELMSASLAGNIRSRGENNRTAILTESDVREIKRRLAAGEGGSDLAREYRVQKSAISKIKAGRNWTHVAP